MEKKSAKDRFLFVMAAVIIAVASFFLCANRCMYSFDKIFSDKWYQQETPTDKKINIIAIDEKTIEKYGDPSDWSREIPARLIAKLNENEGMTPAVIALDMLYASSGEAAGDIALINACKENNNVVTAVNTVYKTKIDSHTKKKDLYHIEMVEYPFEGLDDVTTYGFANATQDTDGYIRQVQLTAEYDGEIIDSFALATYKKYAEVTGGEVICPKTYGNQTFYFTFSGKNKSYEVVSLCDVLEGKVDTRVYANEIVFVGAYAPGLQDAYNVAVQRGTQMYGVEIHANILEAMMEQKTQIPVSSLLFALVIMCICLVYYVLADWLKIIPATILLIILIVADLFGCKWLYENGWFVDLIQLPFLLLLIWAYKMIGGYVMEAVKRRKTLAAFKKYVAPQVVDGLSKKGEFHITLGGEKKQIAVLFVDIRGFTPLSESLKPEEVVEILNEYLNLTTQSIFKNQGTLDKFVGDATMAVFNAPFELNDYIYRAVCTARDIAQGSEALEKRLMERFGKTVSFGIGVHCGEAVVGNIGCDFRMDYTAIGDTVNTAARLESNAKRGQILISEEVFEALSDRIKVTEVGVIPLKGKSKDVFVYQLDEVL